MTRARRRSVSRTPGGGREKPTAKERSKRWPRTGVRAPNVIQEILLNEGADTAWTALDHLLSNGGKSDRHTLSRLLNCTLAANKHRQDLPALRRALDLADKYLEIQPEDSDQVLFNTLLDTCCLVKDLSRLEATHSKMKQMKVAPSSVTLGVLVKAYGQAGNLPKVLQYWDEMAPQRIKANEVTYGCMLDACIKNGNMEKAIEIWEDMKKAGKHKNTVLYTTVIKGHGMRRDLGSALALFREMQVENVHCNNITYNSMVDVCINCNDLALAEQLVSEMKSNPQAPNPDKITYSTLLKGYSFHGEMDKAFKVRDEMTDRGLDKDEQVYNTLIDTCVKANDWSSGVGFFEEMLKKGLQPSAITRSVLGKLANRAGVSEVELETLIDGVYCMHGVKRDGADFMEPRTSSGGRNKFTVMTNSAFKAVDPVTPEKAPHGTTKTTNKLTPISLAKAIAEPAKPAEKELSKAMPEPLKIIIVPNPKLQTSQAVAQRMRAQSLVERPRGGCRPPRTTGLFGQPMRVPLGSVHEQLTVADASTPAPPSTGPPPPPLSVRASSPGPQQAPPSAKRYPAAGGGRRLGPGEVELDAGAAAAAAAMDEPPYYDWWERAAARAAFEGARLRAASVPVAERGSQLILAHGGQPLGQGRPERAPSRVRHAGQGEMPTESKHSAEWWPAGDQPYAAGSAIADGRGHRHPSRAPSRARPAALQQDTAAGHSPPLAPVARAAAETAASTPELWPAGGQMLAAGQRPVGHGAAQVGSGEQSSGDQLITSGCGLLWRASAVSEAPGGSETAGAAGHVGQAEHQSTYAITHSSWWPEDPNIWASGDQLLASGDQLLASIGRHRQNLAREHLRASSRPRPRRLAYAASSPEWWQEGPHHGSSGDQLITSGCGLLWRGSARADLADPAKHPTYADAEWWPGETNMWSCGEQWLSNGATCPAGARRAEHGQGVAQSSDWWAESPSVWQGLRWRASPRPGYAGQLTHKMGSSSEWLWHGADHAYAAGHRPPTGPDSRQVSIGNPVQAEAANGTGASADWWAGFAAGQQLAGGACGSDRASQDEGAMATAASADWWAAEDPSAWQGGDQWHAAGAEWY